MDHAYEAAPDLRRDLTQEIHLALWQSFDKFDGRCSLRTWVCIVDHNVATSHVVHQAKAKRSVQTSLTLEEAEAHAGAEDVEATADRQQALARLLAMIQRRDPDRQDEQDRCDHNYKLNQRVCGHESRC
jgi:RNA polymerase sigma-70 factor (ECF subfamily)